MSLCLCPNVHFSMSVSPCTCLHCHVSMSMSPCLHVHVSMSMSPGPYLHVSISPCPYLHVSGIVQRKNRTNRKWQLLFVCCKWKTETANFLCLLQMETENGRLFSLGGKWTVINDCCFNNRAHLAQISIVIIYAGQQGSLPCLWPLIRLPPLTVFCVMQWRRHIFTISMILEYFLQRIIN